MVTEIKVVIGWFKLQLWTSLAELFDDKLSDNKLSDNNFTSKLVEKRSF